LNYINRNKLVLFGAGKIGRSFIGQLFSCGGYEVVFIDTFKPIIDELNLRGKYKVIIKSDKDEILWIYNVRGVFAGNVQEVTNEIASAGILAVSVGQNGLSVIMPILAKGLLKRFELDRNFPLDIIIAENLRNAADYFKTALKKLLPPLYPIDLLTGFVETSIGKMVPIMLKKDIEEDILQIFAEPYNTLILDKNAFKNPIPDIEGLAPKQNIKAWVDRKLFIHNLGHVATAYLGNVSHPDYIFLYEALENKKIYTQVRETMQQAADLLLKMYPDEFTVRLLSDHIDDLLGRFQNRALGDTIFRIGSDLMRKLSAEDRLSGAIRLAIDLDLPYDKILYALVCGCHFRAKDEEGFMLKEDIKFVNCYQNDIKSIMTEVCGFNENENKRLFTEAEAINKKL